MSVKTCPWRPEPKNGVVVGAEGTKCIKGQQRFVIYHLHPLPLISSLISTTSPISPQTFSTSKMSQPFDASFNPFASHPFTAGGSTMPQPIPRPAATSSPYNQALQYQQTSMSSHPPLPRRSDPSTPPGGYVPSRNIGFPSQAPPQQAVFTAYKVDGRRTPDLDDIVKRGSSQWR